MPGFHIRTSRRSSSRIVAAFFETEEVQTTTSGKEAHRYCFCFGQKEYLAYGIL